MWDRLIHHFQTLEQRPLERMAILVGGLLLFWILEGAIPLLGLRFRKTRLRHAGVNFSLTVIHLVIHTFLAILIVLMSDWCRINQFGIVYWINAGVLATIFITILVVDFFGGWLVHITEHKWKLLWRFHVVHHADTNVDVTTGLRHHPVESILRGVFFFIGIVITGAPMYAVMIYQTILVFFTAFEHANIRLPKWLDTAMGYIFISPNMHKVHHHWKQPYTDSNYGAIFSIWDRLLGTYKNLDPQHLRYGIDKDYPDEKDEDLLLLLKKPFQKLDL
ncbi:MAG TPA: sterol desaturase family protein [Chitinophagaceae bacterium]|nr:sterol desaturase family protein [Chitinophagaceae bacterium]